MNGHDAEGLAAAYMASGVLSPEQRARYERHLLECDACWIEVQEARRGRELSEWMSEPAPAGLRDRIRAAVDLGGSPEPTAPRWQGTRRWLVAALVLLFTTTLGALVVIGGEEEPPRQIDAAVADFRSGITPDTAVRPPVAVLGEFRWQASETADLDGLPVTEHLYADLKGGRVLLIRADAEFARPDGAIGLPAGEWVIRQQSAVVLCVSRPAPYLVVSSDEPRARRVADLLAAR